MALPETSRTCGTCTLCCKVSGIKELDKPAGVWCKFAKPGQGCTIHGQHPRECQTYKCAWLDRPDLADDWKPSISKMVLRIEGPGVFVHVDPDARGAWKKQPYYRGLKKTSEGLWNGTAHVIVYEGHDITVIFPEEDLYVGRNGEGDRVIVGYQKVAASRRPFVRIERASGEVSNFYGAVHPVRGFPPVA